MSLPLLRPGHGDGASGYSPQTLEDIFDGITTRVIEWWDAERVASHAPASERDAAVESAAEAKDEVYQYLGRVIAP